MGSNQAAGQSEDMLVFLRLSKRMEDEVFKDQAGRELTVFPYFEPSLNTEVQWIVGMDEGMDERAENDVIFILNKR